VLRISGKMYGFSVCIAAMRRFRNVEHFHTTTIVDPAALQWCANGHDSKSLASRPGKAYVVEREVSKKNSDKREKSEPSQLSEPSDERPNTENPWWMPPSGVLLRPSCLDLLNLGQIGLCFRWSHRSRSQFQSRSSGELLRVMLAPFVL